MKHDPALAEFRTEFEEAVTRVSGLLGRLESTPNVAEAPEWVSAVYRDIHSLKGGAYLFQFRELGDILHAMESSLEVLRDRSEPLTAARIDALFEQLAAVEARFGEMFSKGAKAGGNDRLKAAPSRFPRLVDNGAPAQAGTSASMAATPAGVSAHETPAQPGPESPAASTAVSAAAGGEVEATRWDETTSIRVNVALLDKMMTLMGEMVLVRNQVLQHSARSEDFEFLRLSQRLDLVTSELQGEMMKTRMQPVGTVVTKFQRVVRDLAKSLGKRIDLATVGMETELDRTLLEAIRDPLTHIIRNACDHGLEKPADRVASGKPEGGTIHVRAFHEGGQVIIEIRDDGRGLVRDRILAKAIEKGLVTAERGARMTDREVQGLIFTPGFSTADTVTNVSGRGVGMDVVKSNVEKVGGFVDLSSQPGRGTTVRLKIPLTLAIVPAMIVRCGPDRYAIPQVRLVELVRVEAGDLNRQVELVQGKPVYRLRGKILPLVGLKDVLKIEGGEVAAPQHSAINIVVLSVEGRNFGLMVDEILDTADIVVKPLSRFLKSLSVYSGATVLGDGSVAFILDAVGLAVRENLMHQEDMDAQAALTASASQTAAKREFLLFRVSAPGKFALPLEQVQRLEEFPVSSIEFSGEQRVVRYRGSVLPLIDLGALLGFPRASHGTATVVPALVVHRNGRSFGLEVQDILDVMETQAVPDDSWADRVGLGGNLVAGDEVIATIDLGWVMERLTERLKPAERRIPEPAAGNGHAGPGSRKVLFAEDAPFLRKQISAILKGAGFEVESVTDGREAVERLEAAGEGEYQLVLSDIEMPRLNGFELVNEIRKHPRWKGIPVIALTSLYDPANIEKGRRSGFNEYLKKISPDELVAAVQRLSERKAA